MNPSHRHTAVTSPGGPVATAADLGVLTPGDTFGGYRIVRQVGRGGMGVVYEAYDDGLKRAVALKTLLPGPAADPDTRTRFLHEAQALAAVRSDFVVTVHKVSEHQGLPFLVMTHLTGESLDTRMKRGPLPLIQVIKYGREVANGLAAAHAAGLVHRDVKPDNIFLDAQLDRAVLIDFGLAYTTRAPDGSGTSQAGTPLYMSPEQLRGDPVDARSDLFGLGVVLYRLCTETWPYFGATLGEWRKRMQSGEPPTPVEQLNPLVPPPLADLIRRLLSRDRDTRPASAAVVEWELVQLYTSVLTFSHSGPVGPVSRLPAVSQATLVALEATDVMPSVRRRRPRWPWWVGGGLVTSAAAVAVGLALLLGHRPPASHTDPTRPTEQAVTIPPSEAPVQIVHKPKREPLPLFDGRSLDAWRGLEGKKTDCWMVRDGVLVGDPRVQGQFLVTKGEFTDFVLTFEFRWREKGGHTSVFLRAKDDGPKAEAAKPPRERVNGLELNIGDDGAVPPDPKKPVMPMHASGGFYRLKGPKPAAPNKPIGEWNAVKVTHDRERLTVEWNGVVTFNEDLDRFDQLHKELPALARTKGAIALRTHGARPIEYRNIVVTPIDR
jgi:hypothetical protein